MSEPSGLKIKLTLPRKPTATTANSAPVKQEPSSLSYSQVAPPPSSSSSSAEELGYIDRDDGSTDIVQFITTHASFTIPKKHPAHSNVAFFTLTSRVGNVKTMVPSRYRIPLLWVSKYMWTCLRIALSSSSSSTSTSSSSPALLHVYHLARVLDHFLKTAKETMGREGMDRKWRCPALDRMLVRLKGKWVVQTRESVELFDKTYGELEYSGKDVLLYDWKRWVLKGHDGFKLTEEEVEDGITADAFMDGLKKGPGRREWTWHSSSTPLDPDLKLPSTVRQRRPLPRRRVPPPPQTKVEPIDVDQPPSISAPTPAPAPPHPPTTHLVLNSTNLQSLLTTFTSTCSSLTTELRALKQEVRLLKESQSHTHTPSHHRYHPYPYSSPSYRYPPLDPPPDSPPSSASASVSESEVAASCLVNVKKEPDISTLTTPPAGPIKSKRKFGKWAAL